MPDEARRAAILSQRRVDLYLRVGAITVAAGHVEYEMNRLLHVVGGGQRYASPDPGLPVDWALLVKRLRAESALRLSAEHQRELADVLDWAERKKLYFSRNTVIHAAWIEHPSAHGMARRLPRNGQAVTVFASYEELDSLAQRLGDFARRLYALTEALTPGQDIHFEWGWPDEEDPPTEVGVGALWARTVQQEPPRVSTGRHGTEPLTGGNRLGRHRPIPPQP